MVLIRTVDHAAAKHGAALYTIQLGLNLAWVPLYFGLWRPIEAAIDVVVLLGVNSYLAYMCETAVDKTAGLLLVPHVAWLGFATYLLAGTGYFNDWGLRDPEDKAGRKAQLCRENKLKNLFDNRGCTSLKIVGTAEMVCVPLHF